MPTTTPTTTPDQIGALPVPFEYASGYASGIADGWSPCRSTHPRSDVTGYVVVATMTPGGRTIRRFGSSVVGVDAGWLPADRYAAALEARDNLMDLLGGHAHAVLQSTYSCGCRAY